MDIRSKMSHRFDTVSGGLFAKVTKADVGECAGQLMAQGYDIMAWADPYFPDPSTPESVQNAMIDAIKGGLVSHYTMPMGDRRLREILASRVSKRFNLTLDPSRNILITPGSDSGLIYAMIPFINEGDEILIPDPSYPSNFVNAKLCGGIPVSVPLNEQNNYQFDMADFEERVTPKTKMVLLTHPNNPTGTVFHKDSIKKLSEFVIRHDLILVCDQAFEDHIYDGIEFVSPASLPGMFERTITVFSISKGLGLSGFRVGYLVADDHAMDVYYGSAVNFLGATNTLAQVGAIAAIEDHSILDRYHSILNERRNIAYDVFSDIPHVHIVKPESGILSWLNISKLGSGAEVASYILEHARVLVNEGAPYGPLGGEGHIRIVHACFADESIARQAYEKIRDALIQLGKEKDLA